jgi:hypothetical protein
LPEKQDRFIIVIRSHRIAVADHDYEERAEQKANKRTQKGKDIEDFSSNFEEHQDYYEYAKEMEKQLHPYEINLSAKNDTQNRENKIVDEKCQNLRFLYHANPPQNMLLIKNAAKSGMELTI